MSRRSKIALIAAGAIAAFVVAVGVAFLITIQTSWFQMRVRKQIVSSTENATGGQSQIGGFHFRWQNLQATIHDFTIHGMEPAGSPPLFHAKTIVVGLSLISPFRGFVDIASLMVDTPEIHLIIFPDGRTNIPAPKTKSARSTLETIVNLAVGRFDLRSGTITIADRKTKFSAQGENLRAHLNYDRANPGYTGEIDISPLLLRKDDNAPIRANVSLPLTLRKDLLALNNAQVTTPASHLTITGRLNNMPSPDGRAHIAGHVNIAELQRASGLQIPFQTKRAPQYVEANINLVIRHGVIGFENSRLVYGNSTVDLTGLFSQPSGERAEFRAKLDLGQLGSLFGLRAQPRGTIFANGDFALTRQGYEVQAAVEGRDLSVVENGARINGIDLVTRAAVSPGRVDVVGLRVDALGGAFAGSASVQSLRQFQLTGNLQHFDLDRLARVFTPAHIGYSGLVSGPVRASGDLKQPAELEAQASLSIAPGRTGVPVSGRLGVSYNGHSGTLLIAPSRLVLPHSTVELAGSLGRQIRVRLVSRDLRDLRPLSSLPVALDGGSLSVEATVTGSPQAPHIAGQAVITSFTVENRPFDRLTASFDATKSGITVANAVLTRGTLSARFDATVGLHNWEPRPSEPLRVDASIRNGDLADALALAGYGSVAASGTFTADAHITGTIGSPLGNVTWNAANGTLRGAHYDAMNGRAILTQTTIDVPTFEWISAPSRIEAFGTYQHAVNQLNQGSFRFSVRSNQVRLAQFESMSNDLAGVSGVLNLQGSAAGVVQPSLAGTGIRFTNLNANIAARGLTVKGKLLGDVTATASTVGNDVTYNVTSNFAESTLRIAGRTSLIGNHETVATANIVNLPIEPLLAVAGENRLPLTGTLTGTAQVSGTLASPHIQATGSVINGSAWGEPFRLAQGTLQYTDQLIQVSNARIEKDGSYLEASGSFVHPAGDYRDGHVTFSLRGSDIHLAQIHVLQSQQSIAGTASVAATGSATLAAGKAPLFSNLNATLSATGLTMNGAPLGDLTARAETRGSQIDVQLASNLAGSTVRGDGTIQMIGEYPTNARVTFSNLSYTHLRPLLRLPEEPLSTSATGNITITGPLARPDALRGALEITQLDVRSAPNTATGMLPRVNLEMRNPGPIRATLSNSVLTIQSFQLAGPYANLGVTGTASINGRQGLAMHVSGNLQLEMLEAFNPDVFSSGNVVLTATIGGTISRPALSGTFQFNHASLNVVSWPNGISNANGTITFTRREAIIQNITGESGGGKVTISGYVGYGGYGGPETTVRLQVAGDRVFVNYPENVTTAVNARLTLAGTTTSSLLTGNVTILDVALHSQTDIGSILNAAAAPRPVSTPSIGFLAGIHFDVRIVTAPDAQFRTSLTQNLQADANLTLRGTFDSPGMLGRVVITEGQIVFFGNRYRIEKGTVAFYDPQKINPYVNIDLDTTVSGVEVTISVNGPMDRLKLTYRSDPPLAFSDVLALLTSGAVNTTDPVLAARQPIQQQQTFQQAGASALLSQAVATPVSGTLQRLFGVTRLQINPQFVSGYAAPQATVSIQQQVTPDLVFTYIQLVGQSNPQVIKVEWTIDPQWAAVAQRDYNGFFYLDFYYKKRFW